MTIKIESGIPMPDSYATRKKYPFDALLVGDSFAAPVASFAGLRSSARAWERRTGCTLAVRRVTEQGVPVVRCWRTA